MNWACSPSIDQNLLFRSAVLRRVIDFALSNLMWSGIELVAILSQYRSYSLINHIGTGAAWDMIGRYRGVSRFCRPLRGMRVRTGTGVLRMPCTRILILSSIMHPSQILILSGDHVYQMDYRKMIEYHVEKDADLTAAFIEVGPGAGTSLRYRRDRF